MSRGITRQSAPSIGSAEWFKYVNENIAPFKPNPQPHSECKEVHSVIFKTNDTAKSTIYAANTLNVSFGVKRVKYSIIAKEHDGAADTHDLFLLSSSLTGTNIGCVSNHQTDMTEIQFGEFIYQRPRDFLLETLTVTTSYVDANGKIKDIGFHGTIVLILELSNY